MRRILLLLAATALAGLPAAAAPDNRLPREGSGWAGLERGTWVRVKQTYQPKGGVPSVTLITTTLKEIGERTLTLHVATENALGVNEETEQVVPKSGEAAEGERAETGEPKRESLDACGRTFECLRTTTTVTAATGKRVVTVWDDPKLKVRVQREVVTYGTDGDVVSRQTLKLTGLDREETVGEQTLPCLEYELSHAEGPITQHGKMLLSREIPGGTVDLQLDVSQGGQVVLQIFSKALAFEVK